MWSNLKKDIYVLEENLLNYWNELRVYKSIDYIVLNYVFEIYLDEIWFLRFKFVILKE